MVIEFGEAANELSLALSVVANVQVVLLLGGLGLLEAVNVEVGERRHRALIL